MSSSRPGIRHFWLALCISLLLTAAAFADTLVDGDATSVQNEIDLTLIPGQPSNLAMAYNDYATGNTLGIAYSSDSGANWLTTQLTMPSSPGAPPLPPPNPPPGWAPLNPMARMFDPTITADASGTLYAACIADGGQNPLANPLGGFDSGLYAFTSTDYGATWSGPNTIAYDLPTTVGSGVDTGYRFNDRCRIRADISGSSTYQNNVYTVWIKDRGLQDKTIPGARPLGDIYFSSFPSGGSVWTAPITINQNTNDMGNIPLMDIASDGTVYLAWLDYNVWTPTTGQIYMRKSTDGGATFTDLTGLSSTDHAIGSPINLPPLWLNDAGGLNDIIGKGNSGTPVAVNPNNPNELYIAYAADPPDGGAGVDEANIYVIKVDSTDGGTTWNVGTPVLVNDDGGITDQAFPWIDIKPDGTIDVAWYDKRNSLNDDAWDVYIAKSTDSGASFSTNYRISDVTAAAPSGWFGEYLGLAVDGSDAYVAFASSRSDIVNGDVWFDSVANSDIPEPATLSLLALGAMLALRTKRS